VNDAAVVHLRKLTGMRLLHLEGTKISPASAATLAPSLPKCAIFYTGGAVVPGWTGYSPFAVPRAAPMGKGKTPPKKPKMPTNEAK
jgi:hypothetical protein